MKLTSVNTDSHWSRLCLIDFNKYAFNYIGKALLVLWSLSFLWNSQSQNMHSKYIWTPYRKLRLYLDHFNGGILTTSVVESTEINNLKLWTYVVKNVTSCQISYVTVLWQVNSGLMFVIWRSWVKDKLCVLN